MCGTKVSSFLGSWPCNGECGTVAGGAGCGSSVGSGSGSGSNAGSGSSVPERRSAGRGCRQARLAAEKMHHSARKDHSGAGVHFVGLRHISFRKAAVAAAMAYQIEERLAASVAYQREEGLVGGEVKPWGSGEAGPRKEVGGGNSLLSVRG